MDSSPPRLCIPKGPVRLSLLRENHYCVTGGHPGRDVDKTFWNLSKHFYWPGMRKSVKDFVRTCDTCQRYNCKSTRAKSGLLQPLSTPSVPWENISMDFVMGLPRPERQNDAILTFVDRLSMLSLFPPSRPLTQREQLAST